IADKGESSGSGQRGRVERRPLTLPPQHFAGHVDREKLAELPLRPGRKIYHTTIAIERLGAHAPPEGELVARQLIRQIERVGLRADRHRTPRVPPCDRGTEVQWFAEFRDLSRTIRNPPGLLVDVDQRLIPEVRGVDELARAAIDLPQNAEFP